MKVIIQIPCLDEEDTLLQTLSDLPSAPELGVQQVDIVIIDDGSKDGTLTKAREYRGSQLVHIVELPSHEGLAVAFRVGLDACLKLGADIIVNTDADGQYDGKEIAMLVQPILKDDADLVVGDRNVGHVAQFSPLKKWLQLRGSRVISKLGHTAIPDATSGFRAYTRSAALKLNLVTNFTYTLESLVEAAHKGVRIQYVPITRHDDTRPSRLAKNVREYLRKSAGTILRLQLLYRPRQFFAVLASMLFAGSAAALVLGMSDTAASGGAARLATLLIVLSMLLLEFLALGVIAYVQGQEHRLSTRALEVARRLELELGVTPSYYEPPQDLDESPAVLDITDGQHPAGDDSHDGGAALSPDKPVQDIEDGPPPVLDITDDQLSGIDESRGDGETGS